MSRRIYQRQIPVFICSLILAVLLVETYSGIKYDPLVGLRKELLLWATILYSWSLLFGYSVMLLSNTRRVLRTPADQRAKQYYASIVILASCAMFLVLGLVLPAGMPGKLWRTFYLYFVSYANAGAFAAGACLAYQYAAYRLLRPSSIETTLFIILWFFTYAREFPAWVALFPQIYQIAQWTADVLSTATQRASLLASAMGATILGIRGLIGREPGLIEMEAVS